MQVFVRFEQLAIMQALVNLSRTDRRNLSIMTSDALLSLFVTIVNFKFLLSSAKKVLFFSCKKVGIGSVSHKSLQLGVFCSFEELSSIFVEWCNQ